MIAYQVEIDGERIVLGGAEDWSILALHITASRGRDLDSVGSTDADEVQFSVGGLTRADAAGIRHHFRWGKPELRVGSSVVVTVVDTEHPDPPVKRYRSDHKVQESPFTDEEMRELRRQDYVALKKEFEGTGQG